jgi:integrase
LTKTRTPTQKLNFTKRSLDSLSPASERVTVFDKQTAGLGLVIFPSGVRSFFHLRFVRGYPQRTTIGRFPEVSVEQARGKASELNAALSSWKLSGYRGDTPFETRRDPTLEDLADQYVEKHLKAHASRPDQAAKSAEWQFAKYLGPWRNRKVGSIRKTDVVELHDRLGRGTGKHTANRVVQFLRALFYWADEAGVWHGVNPASGIKLFHEAKRTRFLQPNELPQLFAALRKEPNVDLRDFVNLAMWTGARRGDILSLRWENLFLEDNRWQVPDPKNRTPYLVALTPEAIKILRDRREFVGDSPWVFPSRGRTGHVVDLKNAWRKLLQRAKLDGLRQHDLRRTLGSYQAAQGTSMKIIGESLGHKSLAATQVYAQLNLDPVRASVMSATRTMIAASKKKLPILLESKPKKLKAARS